MTLIAREIRVGCPALETWLGADDVPIATLRTVQVQDDSGWRSAIVLYGPAGRRIECFDVAGLADSFRRLR